MLELNIEKCKNYIITLLAINAVMIGAFVVLVMDHQTVVDQCNNLIEKYNVYYESEQLGHCTKNFTRPQTNGYNLVSNYSFQLSDFK